MCFLEALRQHPSLTAESDASMERKPRGLSLPWTVPPTTAEGRLPGPGSAPSSVGKPLEWGLHARFLFTVHGQVLIQHGKFGEGFCFFGPWEGSGGSCVPLGPLCLPVWRRCSWTLAESWPWGKGSFVIKKKTGSSVFSPAISGIAS